MMYSICISHVRSVMSGKSYIRRNISQYRSLQQSTRSDRLGINIGKNIWFNSVHRRKWLE